MAQYRVLFMFEFGKQGFSEVWYRQAATPAAATQFFSSDLGNFMALRPAGTVLQAIRASDVALPRSSFLNVINLSTIKQGRPLTVVGDTPQQSVLLTIIGTANRKRPFLMRNIDEILVQFDSNGFAVFSGALGTALTNWFSAMGNMALQFQTLNPADPVLNPDRPVTSLASFVNDPTQTVVTYAGLALPAAPTRVLFHKLSRSAFPGLQAPTPSIPGGAGQIILPVKWTNPSLTVNGGQATVRQAIYQYQLITGYQPVDFRSRKVGSPFLRARGRRSAVHYRSR